MRFIPIVFCIFFCVFATNLEYQNVQSIKASTRLLGYYVPASFPDVYSISFIENTSYSTDSTDVNHYYGKQSVYGKHMAFFIRSAVNDFDTYSLLRADIQEWGKCSSAAVFEMKRKSSYCSDDSVEFVDSYSEGYSKVSDIYYIVNEDWPYDNKESGTWNGTEAIVYHLKGSTYYFMLYVDKNTGRVIGYISTSSSSYREVSFFYSEEIDINDFAIRKDCCDLFSYSAACNKPDFMTGSSSCGLEGNTLIIIIVCLVCPLIISCALVFVIIVMRKRRFNNKINQLLEEIDETPSGTYDAPPRQMGITDDPPPTLGWNDSADQPPSFTPG